MFIPSTLPLSPFQISLFFLHVHSLHQSPIKDKNSSDLTLKVLFEALRRFLSGPHLHNNAYARVWVACARNLRSSGGVARRPCATVKLISCFLSDAADQRGVSSPCDDIPDNELFPEFDSFLSLCMVAKKCLRRHSRLNVQTQKVTLAILHAVPVLLTAVYSLEFSQKLERQGFSVFQSFAIECIRCGIGSKEEHLTSNEYVDLASPCLIVVRAMVCIPEVMGSKGTHFMKDLLPPERVRIMVTSHSHFRLLAENKSCTARGEMISLLVCCATLEGGKSANTEAVLSLMKGYDAGVGEQDCLLRRLLYLYNNVSFI